MCLVGFGGRGINFSVPFIDWNPLNPFSKSSGRSDPEQLSGKRAKLEQSFLGDLIQQSSVRCQKVLNGWREKEI